MLHPTEPPWTAVSNELNKAITPLTITHPGAATSFTFNNTQFLVTPTSGSYLSATDANPTDGLVFTIDFVTSNPPNGSAQTSTSGGALVNWIGATYPQYGRLHLETAATLRHGMTIFQRQDPLPTTRPGTS